MWNSSFEPTCLNKFRAANPLVKTYEPYHMSFLIFFVRIVNNLDNKITGDPDPCLGVLKIARLLNKSKFESLVPCDSVCFIILLYCFGQSSFHLWTKFCFFHFSKKHFPWLDDSISPLVILVTCWPLFLSNPPPLPLLCIGKWQLAFTLSFYVLFFGKH